MTLPPRLLTQLLQMHLGELPADPETVRQGLLAQDPACLETAVDLAGDDLLTHAPRLITLWLTRPALRDKVHRKLAADPLLALESVLPAVMSRCEPFSDGPPVQAWFSAARLEAVFAALREHAETPDAAALVKSLPGLLQQAAFSPDSPFTEAARHSLRRALEESEQRRYPGAVCITPAYACNRDCDFCFTEVRLERYPAAMSFAQFERALDQVVVPSGRNRVNLFGGEPTIVRDMPAFVTELERRKLRFFFSTNGVGVRDILKRMIDSPAAEMVTLHIDREKDYRNDEIRRLRENIRLIAERPLRKVVRYNLTDLASRDWDFVFDLTAALGPTYLSFAVVFPSSDRSNLHAAAAALPAFAEKIVEFVDAVGKRLPNVQQIAMAKPYPLCAFDPQALPQLVSRFDYRNICELHRNDFTEQVFVNPNLAVTPCMALSSEPYVLAPLPSFSAIREAFRERLAPLLGQPMLPDCARCSLSRSVACQGACYAYLQ